MSRRYRLRHRAVLYAIITCVGILLCAEWLAGIAVGDAPATRFFAAQDKNLFRADPELFWTLRPRAVLADEGIRVNGAGFRGPPIEAAEASRARIVCLGDSVTFGFKVRQHESYPARLQAALVDRFAVQVINAGVPGYTSLQGLRRFERDIVPLRPQFVIASFGSNDTLNATRRDSEQRVLSPWMFRLRRLLDRSKLVRWLASTRQEEPQTTRCTPSEFTENLRAMARLAEENGCRIFFFHPLHASREDLRAVGITLPPELAQIDVAGAFVATGPDARSMFQSDDNHPTARGNALMARTIAAFLRESGALDRFAR